MAPGRITMLLRWMPTKKTFHLQVIREREQEHDGHGIRQTGDGPHDGPAKNTDKCPEKILPAKDKIQGTHEILKHIPLRENYQLKKKAGRQGILEQLDHDDVDPAKQPACRQRYPPEVPFCKEQHVQRTKDRTRNKETDLFNTKQKNDRLLTS